MRFLARPKGFVKPRPRNAPPGRFCPAGRKARGTGCSNPPFCCSIKSVQNKKSSTPQGAALGATGRIRTSGLPGRRTTTEWYRLTMKREFCWFCTFAAKTGKSPLLVVTTGFSDILWCCLHSSGQMVVKMQINSVRTYGKNTFNKFQKGSFNSILNIFHRRQLLFQFPGKVTRNLIFAHADRL